MPTHAELLHQFKQLLGTDQQAAEDILEWGNWTMEEWADSFIEGVKDGEYDEQLPLVFSAVLERMNRTGQSIPAVLEGGAAPAAKRQLEIGKTYMYVRQNAKKRSKFDRSIVRVTGGNDYNGWKAIVVKVGPWPTLGRGGAVTVGQVWRNVNPEWLVEVDAPPTEQYQCAGFMLSNGVKYPCGWSTPMSNPSLMCDKCISRRASEQDALNRRIAEDVAIRKERDAAEKAEVERIAAIKKAKEERETFKGARPRHRRVNRG